MAHMHCRPGGSTVLHSWPIHTIELQTPVGSAKLTFMTHAHCSYLDAFQFHICVTQLALQFTDHWVFSTYVHSRSVGDLLHSTRKLSTHKHVNSNEK